MRGDDGTIAIKGAKSSAMLRKTRYEHHISYTDSVHGRLGIGHHTKPLAHLGRWLLGLLMVVGVVAVARWWSGTGEPVAALCITQNVTRGDLTAMVTATGTLTPINQVDVGTELSGIVRSVAVDFNDRVRAGQILARLDTTKLQAQASHIRAALDAARAKAQQTQATLEEARAQLARAEQLAAGELLAQSDLDAARATLKRAEADRLSAAAAVAQSEATLQATETDLDEDGHPLTNHRRGAQPRHAPRS